MCLRDKCFWQKNGGEENKMLKPYYKKNFYLYSILI